MFEIGQEEINAVAKVIQKKQLHRYGNQESQVAAFEENMRKMLGAGHFLGVANGTAALICALTGFEVGPGDEVILPAFTFLASALAVLNVGAIPVVAEIDESLGLDAADVERKLSPRTKAIMPVHMFGLSCALDPLLALARKQRVRIIEDACQSFGGQYKGRRLGSLGDAGAFSFNDHMLITAGEGGGLAISERAAFERALIYHDGGTVLRSQAGGLQTPLFAGDNYRMSEIQAAVLNTQLTRLESLLSRLRARKTRLIEILADCQSFRLTPSNDPQGDCGTNFTVIFESAARRKAVCEKISALNPLYAMCSPLDFARYAYTDWKPVLEQRGGSVPAQNAYLRPENQACRKKLDKDSCPRSLDILERTGGLLLDTRADLDFYEAFAAALRKTAEDTRGGLVVNAGPSPLVGGVPSQSVPLAAVGLPAAGNANLLIGVFKTANQEIGVPGSPTAASGITHSPADPVAGAIEAACARAFDEIKNGCPFAAIAILKDLIKTRPDCAMAYNDLGALYFKLGKKADAYSALLAAVRLAPAGVNALHNLAKVCMALGNVQQAAHAARRILALDAKNKDALQVLAEAGAATKKRIVVITGATRGLGRAMAEEFIKWGHIVWGCGRASAEIQALRQAFGAPHHFEVVDVTAEPQVAQWAKALLGAGAPDLLINNAGVINQPASLWQVPPEEFAQVIDVNIKGATNVIRHFLPAMLQRGSGVIVNFSSGWGRSASAEAAPYCAAKFAVEGLTQALALELPPGMAAVPLSPGMINTDMLRTSMRSTPIEPLKYPEPAQWATRAVPFILQLGPKDNGRSLSIT